MMSTVTGMIKLYEVKGEKNHRKKKRVKDAKEVEKTSKLRRTKYDNVKVAKEFDNGVTTAIYIGTVQSYDGEFYNILYEDGDSEEFDEGDIERGMALYKKAFEQENKKTEGGK